MPFRSNGIMWKPTPLDKMPPNASWSEDAILRVFTENRPDSVNQYIRESGKTYADYVGYILYYDNKESMTYLKDVRDNILFSIPSGAKAKGYTLTFKLNQYYNKHQKKSMVS